MNNKFCLRRKHSVRRLAAFLVAALMVFEVNATSLGMPTLDSAPIKPLNAEIELSVPSAKLALLQASADALIDNNMNRHNVGAQLRIPTQTEVAAVDRILQRVRLLSSWPACLTITAGSKHFALA